MYFIKGAQERSTEMINMLLNQWVSGCFFKRTMEPEEVVRTHASQQSSHGLNVSSSEDVRQWVDHRQTQGVNTDPSFSCRRENNMQSRLFQVAFRAGEHYWPPSSVYLCWMYKAEPPGKRPLACRLSFLQLTSEQRSRRLGSHWGATTDP